MTRKDRKLSEVYRNAVHRVIFVLPLATLLVGCQKQSPSATGTNNLTSEEFAGLFKEEKDKADAWFAALDAAKPSLLSSSSSCVSSRAAW